MSLNGFLKKINSSLVWDIFWKTKLYDNSKKNFWNFLHYIQAPWHLYLLKEASWRKMADWSAVVLLLWIELDIEECPILSLFVVNFQAFLKKSYNKSCPKFKISFWLPFYNICERVSKCTKCEFLQIFFIYSKSSTQHLNV